MRNKSQRFLIIILSVLMVLMMSPQIVWAAVPDAPDNLDAYAVSSSEIDLEWNDVDDASSYYIYRATSSSGTYSLVDSTTATSYEDDSLSAGTRYYYKIKAHNSSGYSSYSSYAYATTEDSSLDAPDNLDATTVSSSSIYLTWDEVDDATSYYVFRSTSPSGTYSKIATVSSEHYTNTGLSSGTTYYYKVQAHNSSDTSAYSSSTHATTSGSSSGTASTDRLAGQTRYETAAKIAENGWTTSYYAIIASGEDYPDALCGAPLAYQYNAPILLTSKNILDGSTSAQLSNLNVKSVFIIGGTGVVSSAVEQSIINKGISVTRIAGTDRYDTSLQVAKTMNSNSTAIIATGSNFPDALSIASIAAMKGYPILLSPKDYLTSGVKTFLGDISNTIVVGGTGVISSTVYYQLPSPTRLSGIDRYATNMSIIKYYKDSFNLDNCYLATGLNFPDALAGSALASLKKAPIFLVGTTLDPTTSSYIKGNVTGSIIAFGGTGVVSASILSSLGPGSSTAAGVPDAPDNLDASAESSSQIYLSWDKVSNATSYYVYRSTSYSGTYTKIATVSTNYYTNNNLLEDTTYYYKVAAVNSYGTSAYSSIISETTDLEDEVDLDTVTGLSATAIRSSEIYLEWDEVDDAAGYYIYRSTSSSGSYSKVGTSSTPYYTCTGLTADKTYYFKVKAYAGTSTSDYYSSYKYAKTLSTSSLSAPTNLQATAESSTSISLTWDAVSGADTYYVFRAKSSSAQYELVKTTNSSSYTDSGLSASTTYYYKLLANDGDGSSGYSSKVYAKTNTAVKPDIPSNVNAEATSSSRIYLTWDAVDGATKYYIYRSTTATGTYIALTNTTNTYYANTGLSSGKTYYYKVRAYNSAGYSDYSDYDSATTD